MRHVYTPVLDLIRQLRALAATIERKDEGRALRAARYHTALGSAPETWRCLEVAEAAGYLKPLDHR